MRLFMLKFTHGVEIGAHLAYLGHHARTGDFNVFQIAYDEDLHKKQIEVMLRFYKTKPNPIIDFIFYIIGSIVRYLCYISPVFLLNKIATALEMFAVFSYEGLANRFPEHREILLEMGETEKKHIEYFKA